MKIRQSHKQPTLCTVTVDGYEGPNTASSRLQKYPEHYWRLPNTDPRNEGKYLFRLHTLDLYFWTAHDASSFMEAAEKMLEAQQVDIVDKPSAPVTHEQVVSPVVQKLENVAIEDPAYRNGQTRSSRSGQTSSTDATYFSNSEAESSKNSKEPEAYKPLAYNPAAPPAPEPIKHREKTPPPPGAEAEGTGLSAAAYDDHLQTISPVPQQRHSSLSQPSYAMSPNPVGHMSSPQSQAPNTPFASPPPFVRQSGQSSASGGITASTSPIPPPPPQSGRTSSTSFAPPPVAVSTQIQISNVAPQQHGAAYSPPPREPNARFYQGSNQPLDSPSAQILGNSYVGPPPQPLQHLQPKYADYLASRPQPQQHPQEPIGGYSDYSYSHQHQQSLYQQGGDYNVHGQVYRPTEEEAHKGKHHKPSESGQPSGRLEQSAGRVDKGVNRFLKKLEKRIG